MTIKALITGRCISIQTAPDGKGVLVRVALADESPVIVEASRKAVQDQLRACRPGQFVSVTGELALAIGTSKHGDAFVRCTLSATAVLPLDGVAA